MSSLVARERALLSLFQIENVQFLVLFYSSSVLSRENLAYTSSIDHSQAAAPFFPLHPPSTSLSVLRPSFRVLRPPISDLRPLNLNLTYYRLHLSLPPGIRYYDIWCIFFDDYLYLSVSSRKNFIYTYIYTYIKFL